MSISVRSRCHRKLRHAENYHCVLPDYDYFDPEYAKKQYPIQLDTDEYIIGVYENTPGDDLASHDVAPEDIKDNIVITDQGLHLCSQTNSEKIYFKDMVALDGLNGIENVEDLMMHIGLKDKRNINILILNKGDACLFWSFFRNVILDQYKLAFRE